MVVTGNAIFLALECECAVAVEHAAWQNLPDSRARTETTYLVTFIGVVACRYFSYSVKDKMLAEWQQNQFCNGKAQLAGYGLSFAENRCLDVHTSDELSAPPSLTSFFNAVNGEDVYIYSKNALFIEEFVYNGTFAVHLGKWNVVLAALFVGDDAIVAFAFVV